MIDEGHIDRFNRKESKAREEARRYVDLNTVEHTDARNVGAEWLCKQTIDRLDIEGFLRGKGWKEESIHAALAHLIVRTVYAPSEWAAHRIMSDNSAACELYSGRQGWTPGVNALYDIPDKLFAMKDELEAHLCSRTDHLFNLENRIVLFDLTNFYFEGRKAQSRKAAFGQWPIAEVREGGTKCYEKVVERTGRAIERYPSIVRFYVIEYVRNTENPAQMADVRWKIKDLSQGYSAARVFTSCAPTCPPLTGARHGTTTTSSAR